MRVFVSCLIDSDICFYVLRQCRFYLITVEKRMLTGIVFCTYPFKNRMENLKLLFRLYVGPAEAMSDLIDRGSWLLACIVVLVVATGFYVTVNDSLNSAY